jgi:hypothetical protein
MSDGALILRDLARYARRFVILTEPQADAIALWILHTHAIEAADCTPYLSIRSAEKRSGKTRLLEVLELLVREPLPAANISDAALFRSIGAEDASPTVLLDEVDAIFGAKARDREDLRGLLNAGYRRGAVVRRMGGAKMTTLEAFAVFCAKAFAGIGELPDTIADRCVPISLTRKTRDEPVARIRRRDALADAEPLQISAASWASHHAPSLAEARPDLPDELDDRAQDVWEPLFAIADRAGDDWPERARRAALALSSNGEREDASAGVQLLGDCCQVFGGQGVDRFTSVGLADALHEIEESPWGEWYGKPITPRGIAKLLSRYRIRPRTIRLHDDTTAKGYKREWFEDAWARYLPSENVTTSQPAPVEGLRAFSIRHEPERVTDENPPNSAWIDACDAVTDEKGGNGNVAGFEDADEAWE